LRIISASSLIVDECETSTLIPPAIKSVHDSIFSAKETLIAAASAIGFAPQTIISASLTNFSAAEIIVSAE